MPTEQQLIVSTEQQLIMPTEQQVLRYILSQCVARWLKYAACMFIHTRLQLLGFAQQCTAKTGGLF